MLCACQGALKEARKADRELLERTLVETAGQPIPAVAAGQMAAAAKPFKENPFYASDLEKGAKEGAVYQADEHVIPVRSWARGSPFARGGSKVTSSVGERSASTPGGDGEYGDLEKYWPGEDIPPREDDGDDDEADDEEVQEEDYLDDSGRPELASLADNPNNSFVEAFNQVYAQYKQDAAAAAASASGSNTPRQEGGGGEDGAPSYEESQRAYAKLSKRLSEPSLKGVAAKQQKQQQDEEEDEDEGGGEDIGDLAAYLGLTDTQGENVFFNNQPGFRADGDGEDEDEEAEEEEDDEDEDYLNDARFEEEEEEEEEEAFQPLKRRGENNNSSGGSNSPRKAQLKTLTKEEVREIQSEYQNLYAALQSPRAAPAPAPAPAPGQGQGQGAAGKSRGLSKSQKAATAGRELQLQLLKAKSRAGVEIKDSVLAPRKEKEREREKRAPRHLAGSDSDDDDQQQQQGQQQGQERTDAEHKHRQYLQSVAAKRKQEDELLLRLALKVTNCLLLPVLSFFSFHLPC